MLNNNLHYTYALDAFTEGESAEDAAEKGIQASDMFKEAEEDEYIVAFKEVGERLPIGNLMFFTRKGMIKKTEWSEYEQRKDVFQATKLNDDDELLAVEEDTTEEDTIMIVTKQGICLNATKDDIPTQGRVSTGVRGIMLRDDDSVVLMTQINGEGEIIIATDEGKFKRVISSSTLDLSAKIATSCNNLASSICVAPKMFLTLSSIFLR